MNPDWIETNSEFSAVFPFLLFCYFSPAKCRRASSKRKNEDGEKRKAKKINIICQYLPRSFSFFLALAVVSSFLFSFPFIFQASFLFLNFLVLNPLVVSLCVSHWIESKENFSFFANILHWRRVVVYVFSSWTCFDRFFQMFTFFISSPQRWICFS